MTAVTYGRRANRRRFAERTAVSPGRSREEIEKLLREAGATAFGFGYDAASAWITCTFTGRAFRFALPLPTAEEARTALREEKKSFHGREPPAERIGIWLQQETWRRWRCLALSVKAKLEAVEVGIDTIETAFMAQLVIPGSAWTVGEVVTKNLLSNRAPLALEGVNE